MAANIPVTDAERQRMKELYESGLTIEQIALEVHRDQMTVKKHLKLAGTQMRSPGAKKGNPSRNHPPEIAIRPPLPTVKTRKHFTGHRRRSIL